MTDDDDVDMLTDGGDHSRDSGKSKKGFVNWDDLVGGTPPEGTWEGNRHRQISKSDFWPFWPFLV